ncbi:MAG: AMIN-like domain-containing (lipo)protein [Gaiellaceae bacterium]
MRRLAVLAAATALVAGCGGSHTPSVPEVALLTGVHVDGTSATFEFRSAPDLVRTQFRPRSRIAESGSGRKVPLQGAAFLVVSFSPAATATADESSVTFSYTGPRRLRPTSPGPMQEIVKIGDFEAQLDWAIGLDRRRPVTVRRDGTTVTLTFG